VDLIDRSFGFTTSVEAAQAAIVSAKTEARCNLPNGIGEGVYKCQLGLVGEEGKKEGRGRGECERAQCEYCSGMYAMNCDTFSA
jgi:hypothetical protein